MNKKSKRLEVELSIKISKAIEELKILTQDKEAFLPTVAFINMIQNLEKIQNEVMNGSYSRINYGIGRIVLDSWPYKSEISNLIMEIDSGYEILKKNQIFNSNETKIKKP